MKGYYFFFFLSACLGILFINTKQVLFIGLNVLLLLYMYKKASIQPVLIMVGCFLFFCFYKTNSPYHLSTTYQSYQVKVKEVKETYCIVNYKDKFILLYTEEQEIFPNDLLSFEANLKKISKDSQLVGFEFQNYLKNKRVYYRGARFIGGRDEYLPIPNAQYNFSEGTYVQNPGYGKFN